MGVKRTPGLAALVVLVALASTATVHAGSAWQLQIQHPDDAFIHSEGSQGPGWVKFLILTSAPNTVYFQDSNLYEFHYDFAVNELAQFAGMTPSDFDDVTLFASEQQAHLGAVLIPPTAAGQHVFPEYGIQLVRQDAYGAAETLGILQTVAANVIASQGVRPYYMPSFEQLAVAETNAAQFESAGFPVSSTARWADGNACYSHGWALGTLKFFTADQIDAAFLAGNLTSEDILLTDGIPAEIPFLAGVISLAPSTPNSHVALLAQTFNVPFAFLADAGDAQTAQSLIGHRVVLRVLDRLAACQVRVVDTDGELNPSTVESILALKAPPVLEISPVETFGAYSAATDGLLLSDIRYFGGKAANFGILRQSIPASSPVSTAFSFDLWTEFLDQVMPGGSTLREEIAQQLSPFTYPPEISTLDNVLNGLRDRIKDDTLFSPAVTSAVLATLQEAAYDFDPGRKLRFRSSTNVEDSDQFTGAGLYDSFSGCLADDLDADTTGPSLCDPGQSNERGVFRAIRKVFASFYNLNAYLERLRHGIDENDVGMALLVHHSFPDPIELANGVATFRRGPGSIKSAYLVLQPGANSVTNPDPGQVPEEVDVYISFDGSFIWPTVIQYSNLLVLGETVLTDPDEYVTLTEHLIAAAAHYETTTQLSEFLLEFEFKKTAPGNALIVTQVRRVPQPDTTPSVTPFLLNEPTEYCLFQGEFSGSVFGNHRTKSRWDVETRSLWLTPGNLQAGFYGETGLEYLEGCLTFDQEGPIPSWPGFTHGYVTGQTDDSWSFGDLQNPRSYTLETPQIPELVAPSASPIVFLRDFGYTYDYTDNGCLPVQVDYATPVPDIDYMGPTTTTTDYALLCPCRAHKETDIRVDRAHADGGVTIETSYYWPKPIDAAAGYTAPLIEFIETTITGLTPQPIVLIGEHSQTYKPGHHNFTAEYMFEPALEPGISQQILDELEAIDVRTIYLFDDFGGATIVTYSEAEWTYHCLSCRGPDGDGDQRCRHEPTFDCDDSNPTVWAEPGEVPALDFVARSQLTWVPPVDPGSDAVLYDTLRADEPVDFLAATCIETNGDDTASSASFTPDVGSAVFYLVRAGNDCPAGDGTLGHASSGAERLGVVCP
ncbi:MAG: hypothetical protein GY716_23100 [bacterium]|nr:hypothetical protein [bacterium]